MIKLSLTLSFVASSLAFGAAAAQTSSTTDTSQKTDPLGTQAQQMEKTSHHAGHHEDDGRVHTITGKGPARLVEGITPPPPPPPVERVTGTSGLVAFLCKVGQDDGCPDGQVCMQMDDGGTRCLTPPELNLSPKPKQSGVLTTR